MSEREREREVIHLNYCFVLQTHPSAWPFIKPVDKTEAPDYYDHIKFPMGRYRNGLISVLRWLHLHYTHQWSFSAIAYVGDVNEI